MCVYNFVTIFNIIITFFMMLYILRLYKHFILIKNSTETFLLFIISTLRI